MKLNPGKRAPVILAVLVIALVVIVRIANPDLPDRVERMTYDQRVRWAQLFPSPCATNLAFIALEDSSIKAVKRKYNFGLYWPRQIYARLVDELAAEGARAVAFDVLFGELRTDHPPLMRDGVLVESDDYFAREIRLASNVILAATSDLTVPKLFATNALAQGWIATERDSDGILRRALAFHDTRRWNPVIEKSAAEYSLDLDGAVIERGKITLTQTSATLAPGENTNTVEIPVDAKNQFALADLLEKVPANMAPRQKAFTLERVWHMGIVIAARELGLDLSRAEVDLPHGKIRLSGPGVVREIPVDKDGYFYVDWRLTPEDPGMLRQPLEHLLERWELRQAGQTNHLKNIFRDQLIVVGSSAQGNDLTDRGATPLEPETLLVSKHWNVANSVITGQFIHRPALWGDLVIIIVSGLLTSLVAWRMRAVTGTLVVFLLIIAYFGVAVWVFIEWRLWLPVVYPLGGAVAMQYGVLLVHRIVFEQQDKRRVKSLFSKLVSPDVVNELLNTESLSLGGVRREVTVLFSDVRGFTTFTDQAQEQVVEFVRRNHLDAAAAEPLYAESARETLEIVNLYLASVADAVKNHGGTLDKYIGDCVMAFWNAPIENETHALAAVEAAIEAQRAIRALNEKRLAENPAREAENQIRVAAGLPARPLHTALQLGSGLNTGLMTVGLMGSNEHIVNYTVFGREVNLASRLEGVSGSGRIIVSAGTHQHLQTHAPALAAQCAELPPVHVKGIKNEVRIFEVPWK